MSYRNWLFALAFVASIFCFSQAAYADPDWGGFWSGDWGSSKVVGKCSGNGTVEVGLGANQNVADLSWDGTCIFSKPQTQPKTLNVPCQIDLTYTLPLPAPGFEQVGSIFVQNWRAACNSGVQVTGLLHCDATKGSPEINDPLGLAGPNGSTITDAICQQVFGSASFPVLDATVQFETANSFGRVIDLSPTTTWDACHADVVNDPTAAASCVDNNDIQKVLSTGTKPVTQAFCTYNPQPIQSNCGGDSGVVTMDLFADKPPNAEAGIISISLGSVDLTSFTVNGVKPTKNGACTIKTNGGQDVIECKFPTCTSRGQFIFSSGIATLTANRNPQPDETIGTGIQCINQVQISK